MGDLRVPREFMRKDERQRWSAAVLILGAMLAGASGCAIAHRNATTGATELWGFGHLTMGATVPKGGRKGIVQGVTMCGVAVGLSDSSGFVSVGWDGQQVIEIVDENTVVYIEQPKCGVLGFPCLTVGGEPANTQDKKGGP